MGYEKRICVLKQVKKGFSADGSPLSGVVYAERLGEELTITPRVAGLSPVKEGRYVLFVWADGKTFCMEMHGNSALKTENAPSVKAGFAALLCFVKGEPEPVAFGSCGAAPAAYSALLCEAAPAQHAARHAEKTAAKKPATPAVPLPPNELPVPTSPNVPRAPTVPLPEPVPEDAPPRDERAAARYDDEAIAAANYFGAAGDGDAQTSDAVQEQQAGAAAPDDAGDLLARPRGTLTYYYEVKEKLDAAFAKYPRDGSLLKAFPRSEWVKTENAYLGVVYGEGVPRYLCVAVEGEAPAPAMKEHAVFVPKDAFSEDVGFWVVFQDADTGEYVSVSAED